MSKRFQPSMKEVRLMKRPKFDVKYNSGPSTSKAAAEAEKHTNIPPTQKDPLQSAAALWDDEEDDALLLATQVAESEIASKPKKPEEAQMEIENEMTFTEFKPSKQQQSTQRVESNIFSQMLEDDDDDGDNDLVSVAAEIEKEAKGIWQSSECKETVFKKPSLPPKPYGKSTMFSDDERPGPSHRKDSSSTTQRTTDPNVVYNKETASEEQLKMLMERLEALKEENVKLSKELTDARETAQTKAGEAKVLRDELKHTKQKLSDIKMEKMFQSDTVNVESQSAIEELKKKVDEKKSQLQVKSLECSVLKINQADESRRLDTSIMDKNMPTETEICESDDISEEILFDLSELVVSEPPASVESTSIVMTDRTFERTEVKSSSRKWNTIIEKEFEDFQRLLAQIELNSDDFDSEITKRIIDSAKKVFLEYCSYVQTFDFGFQEDVLPQHEYNVLEDSSTRLPGCLHLKDPLSPEECSVHIRRYIAILAVFCEKSQKMTHALLAELHEGEPILNIAIDAITKVGFSLDVCMHFGAFEAFAVLLQSMLLHLESDDGEENKSYLKILTNLFKQLVFARPNPWTLYELSFCILDIAHRFPYLFSLLCVNSPPTTFEMDRTKGVYRFSNDSCIMQVYCALLESAFPLYVHLPDTIFELQLKICLNHVRFVFYCLTEQPEFVAIMLSDEDEDDENVAEESTNRQSETFQDDQPSTSKNATASTTKETSTNKSSDTFQVDQPSTSKNASASTTKETSTNKSSDTAAPESLKTEVQCQCFEQLCLTAIRMVWLSLRQWLRIEKYKETELVATISRIAVHLFHFLFCNNYLACLFRNDEDMTKHYLYLICQWWDENEEDMEFSEIQADLFQKFRKSHVIPKLLYEEESKPENIAADLAEWCRLTNDKMDLSHIDTEQIIKNLRLEEDLANPDIFFSLRKERPINMDAYDFS